MRITKYIIPALGATLLLAASCQKDEGVGIKTKADGTTSFNDYGIPTDDDDYGSISSWNSHMYWNLANVHDPSIAWYNGYYYMFGTDASYGNEHEKAAIGKHFQGKRSRDLVSWTHIYGPMNEAPAWVTDSLNSIRGRMNLPAIETPNYGYWAPVIRVVNVNGVPTMRMYYSIIVDNYIKTGKASTEANFDSSWTERAFIGVCESTNPSDCDSWVDKGFVVCSSSDKARDSYGRASWNGDYGSAYFRFNAIDPTYIVDKDGKHWLIYGSWHSGFAQLEINPATGLPVNAYDENGKFKGLGDPWGNNPNYGTRIATRVASGSWARWQGSEAPEIVYKDGWYYLFMAYDGLDIPYNTRVCRSQSINGPFVDLKGTDLTHVGGDAYPIVTHPYKFSKGYGWVGISHCCVFQQEGSGDWFYCSQGRLPVGVNGNASSNALMTGHVRRIVWAPATADTPDDLWPISLPERYAGLSKKAVSESEIAGTWEHIHLYYTRPDSSLPATDLQNAQMRTSKEWEFKADKTFTGYNKAGAAISGTWSFDAGKQFLTITPAGGTAVIVVVAHEADWEASPRVETIVFAGIDKANDATLWGKKVQ